MTLKYLVDTNICIYIAKARPAGVVAHFEQLSVGEMAMSTITYGELLSGACKSQYKERVLKGLNELTHFISPLPIPTDCARHYSNIRDDLRRKGTPIGNNDLWIAAHALSLDVTLVTNNQKEFVCVKGLKVENWC